MRAWQVCQYGDFRKGLSLVDVPEPASGHRVLIRTRAIALGFADLLACAGRYQDRPDVPWTGGLDAVVGVVVDPGAATHVRAADHVVGLPQSPAGGWAEVVALAPHRVFPVPPEVTSQAAAAMFTGFHTARYALLDRAGLKPGDTVLVLGGAGSVGSAAIQLARRAKAVVVATASTAAKREACRRFGADVVLEPSDNLDNAVLDATGRNGVDVVIDPVGGRQHTGALRCLASEGRLVTLGFASGDIPVIRLNRLLLRNVTLVGVYWGAILDTVPQRAAIAHAELMHLAAEGSIAPAIDGTVSFDSIPSGLEWLESRSVVGKLIATLP